VAECLADTQQIALLNAKLFEALEISMDQEASLVDLQPIPLLLYYSHLVNLQARAREY